MVLVHEFGHFIVAKKNNVLVEEFGFGLPPRVFGIKIGETLYSLNWLPFGGFVKLLGEEQEELTKKRLSPSLKNRTFVAKTHFQKMAIITAGVICNFVLGWFIVSYLFTKGVSVPSDNIIIQEVAKNSPAAAAGLAAGDTIDKAKVGDKEHKMVDTRDLLDLSKKYAGKSVTFEVLRGNKKIHINLTPRLHPPKGQGALGLVITSYKNVQYPWYQAPFFGLIEAFKITGIILRELLKTLISFVTFQKVSVEVAGPIGIAKITSQAVKFGSIAVLQLLGILSLNLAVINILPFPALDGGRLALIFYEFVSGRKVNPKIEQRLNLVGFAVLISLILLVTVNDLIKLFIK